VTRGQKVEIVFWRTNFKTFKIVVDSRYKNQNQANDCRRETFSFRDKI